MKIDSKILAFSIFHLNVLGGSAFSIQPPQKTTYQPLYSASYLSGLGNEEGPAGENSSTELNVVPASDSFSGQQASGSPLAKEPETNGLLHPVKNIWESSDSIIVQGGSLRTWSTPTAERIQLSMTSEGRPMNANIELWQGPDNTPSKITVYIEDGSLRPFNVVVETPRGPNSIALYNTGQLEFPFEACVEPDAGPKASEAIALAKDLKIVQGGALKTFPFESAVGSVQVLLRTDGRPLNARIELLQGPNNQKQVMDIYTEDGMERPFFAVVETPGSGNVIRILNTAPMEYPMMASCLPYVVAAEESLSGWR